MPAPAKDKPVPKIKVKLVGDQHYRHQTSWKRKASRQLLDIAGEVRELIGIDLEIVGYEPWESREGDDLYQATARMLDEVDRGEADAVIGFTFRPCPEDKGRRYTDAVTIPYRGMLVSKYYARCQRNSFMPYVMIHEMVHLLGGVHVYDKSLMSPVFADTISLVLDRLNMQIVKITRDMDFQQGYASLSEENLERLAGLYQRAVVAGNHEPVVLNELGAMYMTQRYYDRAKTVLNHALRTDSAFTQVWLRLAECGVRTDSLSAAIELLERGLGYADLPGHIYSALARLYFDAGDKDLAHRCLAAARKYGLAVDSVLWEAVENSGDEKR